VKVLDLEAAKQKAFRLLALRPHSEKELEKKLREKGFPAVVIKETLEKLHDLKYLNDASFANQWARNLVVNKLWGNKKIFASLRGKRPCDGIDKCIHREGARGVVGRRRDGNFNQKESGEKEACHF